MVDRDIGGEGDEKGKPKGHQKRRRRDGPEPPGLEPRENQHQQECGTVELNTVSQHTPQGGRIREESELPGERGDLAHPTRKKAGLQGGGPDPGGRHQQMGQPPGGKQRKNRQNQQKGDQYRAVEIGHRDYDQQRGAEHPGGGGQPGVGPQEAWHPSVFGMERPEPRTQQRQEQEEQQQQQRGPEQQMSLVGIHVDRIQPPVFVQGVADKHSRLSDRPDGLRQRVTRSAPVADKGEDTERGPQKQQCGCRKVSGAASGEQNPQQPQQRAERSESNQAGQVDRPVERESQKIEIATEEIEQEVVPDSVHRKMWIPGRKIGTPRKGTDERGMRREVGKDRVPGVELPVFDVQAGTHHPKAEQQEGRQYEKVSRGQSQETVRGSFRGIFGRSGIGAGPQLQTRGPLA